MEFYPQRLKCSHCTNDLLAAFVTSLIPAQNQISENYRVKACGKTKQVNVPLGKTDNLSLISESHLL